MTGSGITDDHGCVVAEASTLPTPRPAQPIQLWEYQACRLLPPPACCMAGGAITSARHTIISAPNSILAPGGLGMGPAETSESIGNLFKKCPGRSPSAASKSSLPRFLHFSISWHFFGGDCGSPMPCCQSFSLAFTTSSYVQSLSHPTPPPPSLGGWLTD